MKHLLFLFCIFFWVSCIDRDVYIPEPEPGKTLNEDFTGQTKEDEIIQVIAISGSGKYTANVPFYFYAENPYTDESEWKGLTPMFYGLTESNGILKAHVTVPANITQVYIVPGSFGFGSMQTYNLKEGNGSVIFQGTAAAVLAETKSASLRADEEFPCIPVHPANNFNLYTFYEGATDTYNNAPAYTEKAPIPATGISLSPTGAPLINYKNIVTLHDNENTTRIATIANLLFPETGLKFKGDQKAMLSEQNNTDLVVTDDNGAEIWATYLGDGGFNIGVPLQRFNTVCYFHYQENTVPDPKKIHKTILFPNTAPDCIATGTRVQLLYWDEAAGKYTKVFPKGTHIGWCYIQNGYGKEDDAPSKPNRFSAFRMKNLKYFRYSYAPMNREPLNSSQLLSASPYNQAVGFWNEKYKCTIVGMENRFAFSNESGADEDYNDVLFYVTSNPIVKPETDLNDQTPNGPEIEDGSLDDIEIKSEQCGTLAFEDMHPHKGDYDHNDVVIDYQYNLVKNALGELTATETTFQVRAAGGSRTAGFGIELPQFAVNSIKDVTFTSAGGNNEEGYYDTGCNTPVAILYTNIKHAFGTANGFINTLSGSSLVSSEAKTVRVDLVRPMAANESNTITVLRFNPFIFVDARENETHLIDYKPTSRGIAHFNQHDDVSDGITTFYRSADGFAWALDITKTSSLADSWTYPSEGNSIEKAYPGYKEWAQGDHTHTNWFNLSEGVKEYLYLPQENIGK